MLAFIAPGMPGKARAELLQKPIKAAAAAHNKFALSFDPANLGFISASRDRTFVR
jgi:hypothetical protein